MNHADAFYESRTVKDHTCKSCGKKNTTKETEMKIFSTHYTRWETALGSQHFYCENCGAMFKFLKN